MLSVTVRVKYPVLSQTVVKYVGNVPPATFDVGSPTKVAEIPLFARTVPAPSFSVPVTVVEAITVQTLNTNG